MEREFVVHTLDRRERTIKVITEDRFALRPEKGWVRLQRLCFWLLKKIGAHAIDEKMDVRRVVIKPGSVVDAILKQKMIVERFEYGPVSAIYMGPQDFEEIIRQKWDSDRYSFQAEYMHGRKVMGLDVHIVPWMKGLLVV